MGILKGAVKFRGKLNDVVGFKNGNAASEASLYGVRNLQTSVYNPQTNGQIDQRMKLPAAQNFYRAMSGILNHSYQGVKYGGRSYAEFMKRAMLMTSGFPFVEKGDKTPWPGRYVIADGGLAPVFVTAITNGKAVSSVNIEGNITTTVGEVSEQLLAGNAGLLAQGDQLTFVLCYRVNGYPIYRTARFIIDSESTATLSDWANSQQMQLDSDTGKMRFFVSDVTDVIAAAVIVSRPPRSAGAWQRSYTVMYVIDGIAGNMAQLDGVRASYKKQATVTTNSDWYLNQGNEANGGSTGTTERSLVAGEFNGKDNAMFMVTNGQSRVVLTAENRVVYLSNGSAYSISNESPVSTTGISYVRLATVQNYFPDLSYEVQSGSVIEDQP